MTEATTNMNDAEKAVRREARKMAEVLVRKLELEVETAQRRLEAALRTRAHLMDEGKELMSCPLPHTDFTMSAAEYTARLGTLIQLGADVETTHT